MENVEKMMCADICKYLNGSDIVSVCEAMPHIKCILFSKAIVEVLRKYVSTMQWVDATVYRWIYSAISMSKSAESEKTIEEEAELLYKVIHCYRDDRQYRKNFVKYDLPCTDRVFHILVNESQLKELKIYNNFMSTLCIWRLVFGGHRSHETSKWGNFSQTVQHVSNFDLHFNTSKVDNSKRSFDVSAICRYDAVLYVIDSTQHCEMNQSLPQELTTLMTSISSITYDGSSRRPILLILDVDTGCEKHSTSTDGYPDSLMVNLHKLNEIMFKGRNEALEGVDTFNWWRVWRLNQNGKYYENMYEAFQWIAMQVHGILNEENSQSQNASISSCNID